MSANSNALLFKLLDAATQGQPPDEPENQIALLTEILENVKNADTLTDDLDLGGNQIIDSTGDVTVSGRTPALSRSHTVPTSYFSGPAHGEGGGAFFGATVLPDGRAVFAPFSSSNVGLFDPSDNTYTSGPAHGEGSNAFIGATVLPDGRAVFAPRDSSNVGLFDPSNNSYLSGPAHGEGSSAFIGATVLPDGRAVFAPFNSSNVGITSVIPAFANASSSKR